MKNLIIKITTIFCLTILSGQAIATKEISTIPKLVEVVLPYPPGGLVDGTFRHFQKYMSDRGVNLVPSYKPGANGLIAHQALYGMPKDGSAISFTAGGIIAAAELQLRKKLAEPITITGVTIHAVVTYPGSKYENFKDFEAALHAGDPGISIGWHAIGHQLVFNQMFTSMGVKVIPLKVPFKSPAESSNAVVGKHISMAVIPYAIALPLVASGKLKIVVVVGASNFEIPKTITNITVRIPSWQPNDAFMIVGPAGLERDAKDAWAGILKEYLDAAETREFYKQAFLAMDKAGPEQAAKLIQTLAKDLILLNLDK